MTVRINNLPSRVIATAVVTVGWLLQTTSLATATRLSNCPFCSAVALTFSEQINSQDVAVIAKLIENPPTLEPDSDAQFPDGKFEIVGVIKGDGLVSPGMKFSTQIVGEYPIGQTFFVMGTGTPYITWTSPVRASERVHEYLQKLKDLPASGPQRLVFFQKYFEDKEPMLAFDAYDEFAAAPYEDLIAMKKQMDRKRLLGYIQSTETSTNRRKLYFTMLGVCGQPEDIGLLEGFIRSDSRKQQAGLDALVGCYLMLAGKPGLELISKRFITDPEVDYVDLAQVVDALRFHATETNVIDQQDIIPVVRKLLDNPEHADIVIEDLARWGDWTVMEKLVQMFKDADEESNWQRVPIISYLRACPKPEAAKHIEQLRKIDPEAVQRADYYLGIGDSDDDWNDDTSTDSEPAADQKNKPDKTGTGVPESTDQTLSKLITPKVDHQQNLAKESSERRRVATAVFMGDDASDNVVSATFATSRKPEPPTTVSSNHTNEVSNTPLPLDTVDEVAPESTTSDQQRRVAATSTSTRRLNTVGNSSTGSKEPASTSLILKIMLIPMAGSLFVLGLMWSVVNGWFERLIF